MSGEEHLSALEVKHHDLDSKIDDEMHRPAPDQSLLTTLKREKLRIKEEIKRIRD